MSAAVDTITVAVQRPHRADARRNFDALLTAARTAFAENGTEASLEDIARRAGVGIGTLYRNFPTRAVLIEAVYIDGAEDLVRAAAEVAGLPPWEALQRWLWRFVEYAATKKVLIEALNRESAMVRSCRDAFYNAGEPLLKRAQAAGEVRADTDIDDVMRLIAGVAGVTFPSAEQRQRVLAMAIDGLRLSRA
ncbi:MAG: TetR/AcrR family transcriptional regulator [Devosia sp.]|uniref:TetR/AcrR family transcriptional regulator n=1 Tax=Devosia sp. TaxID=1871048 RepID=UPI002604922E|nr:TetR/AcrR family transcriptional regulator [Devosia sp.]MDB5586743.1 TetR/AcrR family transcriptional regulator [Devosia sp.]